MTVSPELPPEAIRDLGRWVADFVADYLATLSEQPIADPTATPARLQAQLDEPLPRAAQGVETALEDFRRKIVAPSVRVGHPRFLAWMRTSPLAGAVFAEALAAALNQSVAVWQGAPAATETERLVLRWLLSLSGYAPEAEGILTSGGSMANFVGMLLARQAAFPEVRQKGLRAMPPAAVYLSPEAHYSQVKAVEMMGLGKEAVRCIPTDAARRMRPDALQEAIRADKRRGIVPLAVGVTIGTTATGACDPIADIAAICAEEGVWLHVDGAYGGLAASIPTAAACARGLAQADSFTVDPHKTLFVPFEAGAVFTRHRGLLPATFGARAAYLPNAEEGFQFRDYGPQLSRNFRALKIYLTLKIYGADAILSTWERLHRLAAQFGALLEAAPDFQLVTPVSMGIVAFRYAPADLTDEAALNALNHALVPVLQQQGEAFLSRTHLGETEALRACFISYRTTEDDLARIMEAVRKAGESVRAQWRAAPEAPPLPQSPPASDCAQATPKTP